MDEMDNGILQTRIKWEIATMNAMIRLYCKHNHSRSPTLCSDCHEIKVYAESKLKQCPHGKNKPACKNCIVHCFDQMHRERIKTIMRYSGPRMIIYHPILAIRHILVSRGKPSSNKLKQDMT